MSRKMKDSGVKWIGEIPEDWEIIKAKYLVSISTGDKDTVDSVENGEYPFFVRSENIQKINTFVYDGEGVLTAGDGNIGEIFHYINGKFNFHQRVYLFNKFNKVSGKYFYYFLMSNLKKHISVYSAKTTVDSLRLPWLKDFSVALPPKLQQKTITDVLDQKVAQIDHIIEKTKESIEEYKKYKQSLITETVTKGLKQDIEMKDSRVEWIGEIPKHWKTKKLKHLFFINKEIAGQEGFDILSVTQSGLKIKDISSNEGQMAADYSKYQLVRKGDFVMNHMDLLTGGIDCSIYNGVTSPDYRVFRFRNNEKHSSEYYKYYFQMCYINRIFYGLGQGVSKKGRWRLQTEQFLNFEIPVPPKNEQELISNYLQTKCGHINCIVEQKEKLIGNLESYKKSLIYEYVTGKKQVV